MRKALAALLAAALALALFCSCTGPWAEPEPTETAPTPVPTERATEAPAVTPDPEAGERMSFNICSSSLPACWSAFSARNEDEELICSLISPPLVYRQVADAEEGGWQWAFGLAESVKDVTSTHRSDLLMYSVNTNGFVPTAVSQGCVYEVKLRGGLCWENGECITAEDVVASLRLLLEPSARLAAAAEFCAADAAPAGCERYYLSQREDKLLPVAAAGFRSNASAIASKRKVMIDVWELGGLRGAVNAAGEECARWLPINDTEAYFAVGGPEEGVSAKALWDEYSAELEVGAELEYCCEVLVENYSRGVSFEDAVGVYVTGELTFNYVCPRKVELDVFLDSLARIRLVYEPYYVRAAETDELDIPFGYCTNDTNTMSCGPYRVTGYERGRSVTLSRNPDWYGWSVASDGSPYAFTDYLVSGVRLQRYAATELTFTQAAYEEASALLESGEAELLRPTAEEAKRYSGSGKLVSDASLSTLLLIVDPDAESLAVLDAEKGNKNSVVLSDPDFRRAMTLAFDRTSICAEVGGRPELGLIASGCLADPNEGVVYRETEAAKLALCALYGVSYGPSERYKDLDSAAASLTGFDRQAAHELMKSAGERLIEEGVYEAEAPIHIRVLCPHTAPTANETKLIATLERYLNIAAAGTPIGKIKLEAAGGTDRGTTPVIAGEFALGLSFFDGSEPFLAIRRAADPDLFPSNNLFRGAQTALLTIKKRGNDVILSWKDWAARLSGSGRYASEKLDSRVALLASMEQNLLESCVCIPLLTTVERSIMTDKARPLINAYSPLYGRGGFELMTFNYTDAEWAQMHLPDYSE